MSKISPISIAINQNWFTTELKNVMCEQAILNGLKNGFTIMVTIARHFEEICGEPENFSLLHGRESHDSVRLLTQVFPVLYPNFLTAALVHF